MLSPLYAAVSCAMAWIQTRPHAQNTWYHNPSPTSISKHTKLLSLLTGTIVLDPNAECFLATLVRRRADPHCGPQSHLSMASWPEATASPHIHTHIPIRSSTAKRLTISHLWPIQVGAAERGFELSSWWRWASLYSLINRWRSCTSPKYSELQDWIFKSPIFCHLENIGL